MVGSASMVQEPIHNTGENNQKIKKRPRPNSPLGTETSHKDPGTRKHEPLRQIYTKPATPAQPGEKALS